MGACGVKTSLKFITETKRNQETKIPYSFFFRLQNESKLLD